MAARSSWRDEANDAKTPNSRVRFQQNILHLAGQRRNQFKPRSQHMN